jgi:hypothetical protein
VSLDVFGSGIGVLEAMLEVLTRGGVSGAVHRRCGGSVRSFLYSLHMERGGDHTIPDIRRIE